MGCDGLAFGEEAVSVFAEAMQIAEERLFVAREREEADRHGNADVDADLTAVGADIRYDGNPIL